MANTKPSRIYWWEPRWSFVPREYQNFKTSMRVRSWLRIVVISAAIAIPLGVFANAMIPGLQFDWVAGFFLSVAAVVGIMLAILLATVTIPMLIFVTPNGFGWWIPLLMHDGIDYVKISELQSVTLTIRDDGLHYLRFRTKKFCKRFGIAQRVDLDKLATIIGDRLVIHDRRGSRPR